mmetsp:Transcript_18555/g.27949  ORF Transcript_18555/g.27949 Transcript_18555/m.27949 type:complete len:212 (-) Transcript_18555:2281-2916(-)
MIFEQLNAKAYPIPDVELISHRQLFQLRAPLSHQHPQLGVEPYVLPHLNEMQARSNRPLFLLPVPSTGLVSRNSKRFQYLLKLYIIRLPCQNNLILKHVWRHQKLSVRFDHEVIYFRRVKQPRSKRQLNHFLVKKNLHLNIIQSHHDNLDFVQAFDQSQDMLTLIVDHPTMVTIILHHSLDEVSDVELPGALPPFGQYLYMPLMPIQDDRL